MADSKPQRSEFAFGDTKVDGCPCPAKATGYDPADPAIYDAVEAFDHEAQRHVNANRRGFGLERTKRGTLSADEAREIWKQVLMHTKLSPEGREASREILRVLGGDPNE